MERYQDDKPRLLIVEDDEELRGQLKWALDSEYRVLEAGDRRSAVALVGRESPRLVLLDLGLPPAVDDATEGLSTLAEILRTDPCIKVIITTGNSDRVNALAAVEGGAYDYVEKPVQLDLLRVLLDRAAYLGQLETENRKLQEQAAINGFGEILGASPAIRDLLEKVRRIAIPDIPVLITGESGTGKELVARVIHRLSPRSEGTFVAINCGAIPETLLESELFGYEKGAFTGAQRQQKGKFEFAEGGTLFLDEIGEMPLSLQVKLLRFLQDGRLERLGGRESITVNTRVLAATNRDLKEAVPEGRFREDLFYRLSVVQLTVPPLRERGEDAVMLARTFLSRYRSLNPRVTGLSAEGREAVRIHSWPGNVRELENRIKRAVLLAEGQTITPADLELAMPEAQPTRMTLRHSRAQVEKELILRVLVSQNWNISRAAEDLGVTRPTLYTIMKKHGLEKPV